MIKEVLNKYYKIKNKIPLVTIIGKPNVGKSSLFNCIIRDKKAIVDETPGVTRDNNITLTHHQNSYFNIIDTGGLIYSDNSIKDIFSSLIKENTVNILEKSRIILFVIDVNNIDYEDYQIYANIVKRNKDKVILLINKCDNSKIMNESLDIISKFHTYSYEFISTTHRININNILSYITNTLKNKYSIHITLEDIKNLSLSKEDYKYNSNKESEEKSLNKKTEDIVNSSTIKIAIIGKPNSGKSSLLNYILKEEKSIVSSVEGTTRDSIESSFIYEGQKINFIDTAGIRRKSKIIKDEEKNKIEFYSTKRAIESIKSSDITLLLIDMQENISIQDKKIASIATKLNKGLIICFTKWDLLSTTYFKNFKDYCDKARFMFNIVHHIPMIKFSVKLDYKIGSLIKKVIQVYTSYNTRVSTGILNKFIYNLNLDNKAKPYKLKIYYMTQVNISPPKFIFFVNKVSLFNYNYRKYIINTMRREFKLYGTPILYKINEKVNTRHINK